MIGTNNWQAYMRFSNIKIIGSRRDFRGRRAPYAVTNDRNNLRVGWMHPRNFLDGSHCILVALFF